MALLRGEVGHFSALGRSLAASMTQMSDQEDDIETISDELAVLRGRVGHIQTLRDELAVVRDELAVLRREFNNICETLRRRATSALSSTQ